MEKISFDGFPEKISDVIELPNIAELILMPFFQWADIHDVYQHGSDFQKFLIDKTPLNNKTKYVNVICQVQFLQPSIISLANKLKEYERNWHVDGAIFEQSNDQSHLLLNSVEARTEFNTIPFDLFYENDKNRTTENYLQIIKQLNEQDSELNPVKIEPNKIISFSPFHVHRAPQPTRNELRFMWRVYESDHKAPQQLDKSLSNKSIVGKHTKMLKSIEKHENGFMIYFNH